MKNIRRIANEKGTTFVSTMIAMLIMLLTAGYMYTMSDNGLFVVKRLEYSTQAKYLSDAGLATAFGSLKNNWSASTSYASTSLGPGTYSASVSTASGRTLVTATGAAGSVTRTSTAEVLAPGVSVLDYMFAAGGNLDLDSGTSNSPATITGNVYSGGNITLDGASTGEDLTITGDVDAVGEIDSGSDVNVSGTQTENFSTATFPTIDYSYYQAIAAANGYYYTTDKTYTTSSPLPTTPVGGVIYVNGNVTINGTQNSTVCIVATGNIIIQKAGSSYPRVTINQFGNYPAFLNAGNFTFKSTGNGGAYLTVAGLIYTQGNLLISTGNHDTTTLTGAVWALGNIDITPQSFNNLTATYSEPSAPGLDFGVSEMTVRSYNT